MHVTNLLTVLTRKPSVEAGIQRNAICYNTLNEIWTLEIQPQPCRSGCLAEAVHDSLVILLRRPIKRRLISLSPFSESIATSRDSFVNLTKTIWYAVTLLCTAAILSAILELICNQICVKLLQLMCAVITHNSWKNEVSVLINGWVIANYSVSRPPICPPSWNLLSDLC